MDDLASIVDDIPSGCGPIGLLSGDEFLPQAREFDAMLLAATGRRVALWLCADPRAAPRSAQLAREHFGGLGASTTVVDVLRREDALLERLPVFDVLYLGGGSPADLLACLRGTPLWDAALEQWRSGCGLAGASAGAMALCTHTLTPAPGASLPERWGNGLGPLERFALAVHASSRPRAWLDGVAASAPVPVVALDDATGMLLAAGAAPRTAGPGRVWIAEA